MDVTQEQYNKYLKFARIITSGNRYEADELVQDVLLKLIEKDLPNEKINDNHVFIIMKNFFLNKKDKENRRKHINNHSLEFIDDIYENDEILIDLEDINDVDKVFQIKLNTISEIVNKLPSYEKKLFYLHYIKGISQRKISENTGIGMMPIWYKITAIKNKIITEYKQNG